MWLDRLAGTAPSSGSSTPQPASRPYSPLPRRTSSTLSPYATSHRAAPSPRSSSLSLVSNDSTSSLLASSRKPNGSGLRQSIVPEADYDPLEILETQLSQSSADAQDPVSHHQIVSITEADLAIEADFESLPLKEFAASPHPEPLSTTARRSQTHEECALYLSTLDDSRS